MTNKSSKSRSQKTAKKNQNKIPKNETLTQPSTEERVPVSATDPATPATPLSPPEIEGGAQPEGDAPQVPPTEPTTAPELPEADKEKPAKKSIPKVNKPKVEKKPQVKVDMAQEVQEAQELVDNAHKQLNPAQAVAWANTQNDPVQAVKRLIRDRRLNSPTDTLKLLEDQGLEV